MRKDRLCGPSLGARASCPPDYILCGLEARAPRKTMYTLFGERMDSVIDELNEALAA